MIGVTAGPIGAQETRGGTELLLSAPPDGACTATDPGMLLPGSNWFKRHRPPGAIVIGMGPIFRFIQKIVIFLRLDRIFDHQEPVPSFALVGPPAECTLQIQRYRALERASPTRPDTIAIPRVRAAGADDALPPDQLDCLLLALIDSGGLRHKCPLLVEKQLCPGRPRSAQLIPSGHEAR
jgi:hypothetical protein